MSRGPSLVVSCPHGETCPGCPLLALPYDEQLVAKRRRVSGVVGRFTELADCTVADVVPADPVVEYRVRAKLVVGAGKIGLFARGSHDVVDIPACRVLDPAIREVAEALRRELPLEVPLSGVDLQRVETGVLVTVVVPEGTSEDAVASVAARLSKSLRGAAGIAVSRRAEGAHRVLGGAPVSVTGVTRAPSRVLPDGPFHYIVPGAFAQAHPGQQRALFRAILGAIERERGSVEGATVLELFAGASALSLTFAARGARVVAAEAFEPAVRLARDAAAAQGLSVELEAGDASEVVRRLRNAGRRFDVVVVNPPRRGLSPELRADIARLSPALVVYVSCEPSTLARDLADLSRHGLAARPLSPYDMMPLTEEVETLALLSPVAPPPPTVLHRDERLIAVAKAPHEPTTPQGEHERSLLARVRALPGAGRAVPVHRLDLGTSGVCLFACGPEHVPELAKALTLGEKEYTALARGIVRDKGSINRPLWEQGRVQDARTRYVRKAIVGGHSLVSVRPDQGRKHQIRRHLASIGHPVLGDARHGDRRSNQYFEMRHSLDRPFLHCSRIVLARTEGNLELTAALEPDLEIVLESLQADEK